MLDEDLAVLYGVETKNLNKAVNRNMDRFPEKFRFQLTQEEYDNLKFQIGTSSLDASLRSQFVTLEKQHGGRRYLPYVFTEQGVSMLSAVLRSKTAIEVSIKIIDSFVNMRKFLSQNASLFTRIDSIEKRQISYEIKNDTKVDAILNAIEEKGTPQKQHIFYDGQIFDAYFFVSDIIKSAKSSIKLIDNYIDESTLVLFTKKDAKVDMKIYTKTISKQLKLDLEKHNAQYPKIDIEIFDLSHDRFLIIDEKDIYHFGASLKDLGKKWFAVSKMDINSFELLGKLK
ncbi:ORF6N domain-containing protein [Aliarcobacter butzleri]|uniref:ORF6N domain-containing protein n=1 Tax=Aliarcobacter butzleri TaxID=28197 RepID=UPI000DB6C279|nr:ORF6N domain-containing protein [Aliarcobacter butzleri]MDN5062010.1 ORF6N domain-containing protein [Aliarcobacter butzleri]PZQ05892.1 MAG: DNA-binding protein [Aliarcobacter butzleri]